MLAANGLLPKCLTAPQTKQHTLLAPSYSIPFLLYVMWLQVPEAQKSEEKREGVEEVELVFALPMEADGTTAAPDSNAQLFAFLPVRPYGFRWGLTLA